MQLLCVEIFVFNQREKDLNCPPQDLCELLAVKLNVPLLETDVVTGKILNLQRIVRKSVKLLEERPMHLYLCAYFFN